LASKIPLLQADISHCPVSILSDPRSGDYIVFDTAANCHRISGETGASAYAIVSNVNPDSDLRRGLDDLFGMHRSRVITRDTSMKYSQHQSADDSLDRSVDLLATSSFALPPVNVLFQNAVRSIFERR
jgi:hypothetical protein